MFNMEKISILLTFGLAVSVVLAFSAVDSFGQKGGKGRYRKVSLKKDARKNGYKIKTEGDVNYFEATNVVDPVTKKLLEALKEVEFRCRQNDPLIRLPLTFSNGNSQRISVSCVVLIEPQILLLDEPD